MEPTRIASLPLNTISNIIPLKLKDDKFLVWKTLITTLFRKFQVQNYLDGSSCPVKFISRVFENRNIVNPLFTEREQEDSIILLWIQSAISDSVIGYVAGASTSHELWSNIERRFSKVSTTHAIQLRTRLQTIKQGTNSVSTLLADLKKIEDELVAASSPIFDTEMVVIILSALSNDYASFSTSIRIRNPPVSSTELHNLLISGELVVNQQIATKKIENEAKAFAAMIFSSSYSSNYS
ncbi:uncharacterized protein LOC113342020 [Papaver somniferum]|uniref:uncharacterized protein LOC113342020 n=1 Tax=Papaver somniferum TaxID=3469 RepID=UPI000E701491|nr:uncharacterized protein LOC113342020 [Papaver somniferum]